MIGDTLRKEREKQKLSIKDIGQATSIRSVYIDALEKGEYDKLPGEVYAKGFIKNYGNFLNLEGDELVRQFIMEISTIAAPAEETVKETSKNSIAATNIGEKYRDESVSDNSAASENDSKKYLVAAAALIVILLGGIFYTFSGNDEENITIAQIETPAPAVETPQIETVVETPMVAQVTEMPKIPEPATPAPVQGVNLQATFSGDCWTRVVVDGVLAYEGMFTAGQSQDWKGNQNVEVLIGNAGAAQFVMNGQSVGTLGAYGDVVEKTFTR